MKPIHLHLCDDHELITESLGYMLDSESFIASIRVSKSAQELLESLHHEKPDVLILDLNVNKVNMLDHLAKIHDLAPEVKIMVLSAYDSLSIIRRAFKEGVNAYLFKSASREEIVEALQTIASDRVYVSKLGSEDAAAPADSFQLIEQLSEREKDVIRCLVAGYPNKKISDTLHISITTVQTHRRNIYRKLKIRGVGELVSFAINNRI